MSANAESFARFVPVANTLYENATGHEERR